MVSPSLLCPLALVQWSMGWNCAVCGQYVKTLDLMFASGCKDDMGRWLLTCSMCNAPMHRECFTHSALSSHIAAEVSKVSSLRRKDVHGIGTGYFLCTNCKAYVMGPFFEERVRFYEETRRLEELALLYEAYGYLELAGAARERASGRTVKNIHLDLNSLIESLQRRGLCQQDTSARAAGRR